MSTLELTVTPPSHQIIKNTNQLKFLKKLLEEKIIKKDIAVEFYSLIPKTNVQNPMDFKTVELRLNNYFYGRGRECIKDIHLVFSNASKDIENSKSTTDNAKILENIFYAELEALPKPEIDLPYISERGSKSTKVIKQSSATLNMKEKKYVGNSRTSKLLKMLKSTSGRISEKKTKTSKKNNNVEVKKFQELVDKILADVNKITVPLDFIDHLKLYDSLSKVKSMHENFKQYSAVKQKKEAPKTVNKPIPKAGPSKKIISNKPVEPKEEIPSSSRVEIPPSQQKDVPVKQKSSLTVPNVKKSPIQNKPLMDLDTLLRSERFRPATTRPIVTAERKKLREIEHQNRIRLGGKINFYRAADIMRAFEKQNGLYSYCNRGRDVPRNTSAVTIR